MLALCLGRPALAAWGIDGTVVCNAANSQYGAVAVSDGAGGVLIAWTDERLSSSSPAVFFQRVSPTGAPLLAVNGVKISTAPGPTVKVSMADDGAGGAFVAYLYGDPSDRGIDVYAQHLLSSGAVAWGASGVPVCTIHGSTSSPINKDMPTICPDGAGGAFIAWEDLRAGGGNRDIYAQHVNSSGVAQWALNGVPLCTNIQAQTLPSITSGAAGTAVVIWYDPRNGNQDIFAQKVNDPAGGVSWTGDGVAVCNAAGTQSDLRTLADGSGAYAAWSDERAGVGVFNAYIQRLDPATGNGLYAANGQLVSTVGAGYKLRPSIVASPGGTLIAWQDHRNGFDDIYAQRFDAAGNQVWVNGGVRLTDLSSHQELTLATPDGSGGAFVACRDLRSGGSTIGMLGHVDLNGNLAWPINGTFTSTLTPTTPRAVVVDGAGGAFLIWEGAAGNDIFAQRVTASSNLADYDAVVSAVSDLPGDEGGFVRIAASGAIGDYAPGIPPANGYNVWRQIGTGGSLTSPETAQARGLAALAAASRAGDRVRLDPTAAKAVGFPSGSWESLGFTASRGQTAYTIAVATPSDSTGLDPADRNYVLTVHTTTPSIYSVSNTMAGHSVDNLAPGAPQGVAGTLSAPSSVQLTWSANMEPDLTHYAVYRGTSASFTPSPANRIGTPAATTLSDATFSGFYYKISAVDRHGNESAFTTLQPSNIAGVEPEEVPSVSFLGRPAPNPFPSRTTVALAMAQSGRATLRVFDMAGRLVRVLVDEVVPAGTRSVTWDGRDSRGRSVAAGVYLFRFEGGGVTTVRQVLIAR